MSNTPNDHVPPQEILSFTLGSEEYGINILNVREIRGYTAVTPLADAPAFIKGVINLRGEIVPILDLRIRFGVSQPVYNEFTVVMILQWQQRSVGLVVDSVSDVITISPGQIKPPPKLSAAFDTRYLQGLLAIENRLIVLLDIEGLLSSKDMALIDETDVDREAIEPSNQEQK